MVKLTFSYLHFVQFLLPLVCKVSLSVAYSDSYGNTNRQKERDSNKNYASGATNFTITSVSCKTNEATIYYNNCGSSSSPCPVNEETFLTFKGTYEISSKSTPFPTQDVTVCGKLQTSSGKVFYQGECRRVDDLCEEYVDCVSGKFKYVYDYDEKKAVKQWYDTDWLVKAAGEYYFVLQDLEISKDMYEYSLYRYGVGDVEFIVSMYYDYSDNNRRDEDEPWRYQTLVEQCTIEIATTYQYKSNVSTYYSVMAGVLIMGTAAAAFFRKKDRRRGKTLLGDDEKEGSVAIEMPTQPIA